MAKLGRLTASLRDMSRRAEERPLDYIRWLPAQQRFLSSSAPRKLFRAGNQSQGKTTAGLSEVIYRCMGAHPFLAVPPPPIEAVIITASWAQGLAIQQKLWELLPAEVLHPDTEYDPIRGFRGRNPAARFQNGSIIRMKTTQQGALQLAGSSIQVALFDEPPTSPRIYAEVSKRLQRAGTGGALLLAMTPVNAPVDWIRELCESGQIEDIHSPLTPEAMIPVGYQQPLRLDDGTPCDADWIAQVRGESLPMEVPVVVDGEWEFRTYDRVFTAWDTDIHITTDLPDGKATVRIGIDYGSKLLKQVAVLTACRGAPGIERVWVLDETVSGSRSSVRDDARDILAMLKRNGLGWKDVDEAWGDRLYLRGRSDRKSNEDLSRELARELGIRADALRPAIRTVKRGKGRAAGSVSAGCRWLHQAMLRDGGFHVHPQCERVIESLNRWDYTTTSEWKDATDALRYSLQSAIFMSRPRTKTTLRLG